MFLCKSVHAQGADDVLLTPVADESVNSEGTFVMGNRIDVAVAPSTGGHPLVLIVGGLHLELLQDVRHRCRCEVEGPSNLFSNAGAEARYMYSNACLSEAEGRPFISGVPGPRPGG
jgi:hypothetical protein